MTNRTLSQLRLYNRGYDVESFISKIGYINQLKAYGCDVVHEELYHKYIEISKAMGYCLEVPVIKDFVEYRNIGIKNHIGKIERLENNIDLDRIDNESYQNYITIEKKVGMYAYLYYNKGVLDKVYVIKDGIYIKDITDYKISGILLELDNQQNVEIMGIITLKNLDVDNKLHLECLCQFKHCVFYAYNIHYQRHRKGDTDRDFNYLQKLGFNVPEYGISSKAIKIADKLNHVTYRYVYLYRLNDSKHMFMIDTYYYNNKCIEGSILDIEACEGKYGLGAEVRVVVDGEEHRLHVNNITDLIMNNYFIGNEIHLKKLNNGEYEILNNNSMFLV